MDKLPAMGREIFPVIMPTVQALAPELLKNKSKILSIPRVTHTYGTHPRQKLDFYTASSNPSTAPILIFLYGGGFFSGDKIVAEFPESLVYHNLGSFFAQRGYTTIIADYRRVHPEENAVFPSGAEDLAGVLGWLEKYLAENGGGKRDVFLMGNSAGGVHVATYLLHPEFREDRLKITTGENGLVKVRGAILVSIPAHYEQAKEVRADILTAYYGPDDGIKKLSPFGLLESAVSEKGSQKERGIPDVLAISAEFDPVDEIVKTDEDFVGLWKKSWADGLEYRVIEKHNHISPPIALGTEDEVAEKWGVEVIKWMEGKR